MKAYNYLFLYIFIYYLFWKMHITRRRIIHHMKKFYGKYVFWCFGVAILLFWLFYLVPVLASTPKEITIYTLLWTFEQIEAVALQKDELLHTQWNGYDMKWDEIFHGADTKYQSIPLWDSGLKLEQAKILNTLILAQDDVFHEQDVWSTYPYDDVFHQLEIKFTQLQNIFIHNQK